LETSGALDIGLVDERVHIIMDIKCPSSLMASRMRWENIEHLRAKDEVKFVIADRQDYEYARHVIQRYRLSDRCIVHLSPTSRLGNGQELAGWILEDRLGARLQLQLHRLLWPDVARGV
jgi:7-carboxy-7-deazaguanine synthase